MQLKNQFLYDHLKDRLEQLSLQRGERKWNSYRNFWPPTVMRALTARKLVFFMGAGISADSDLPAWRVLLEERIGIPADFVRDEYLKNDNLTLGELASRIVGRDTLQEILKNIYINSKSGPTSTHYCLAALDLPIYVTTNYDMLFEDAWKKLHGRDIFVVCNSGDMSKADYSTAQHKLFKIHGTANRPDEMLVLTRSDYRRHYRSNFGMFSHLQVVLQERPTVFVGFSHTDPEVGRLIDDVIFHFERDGKYSTKNSGPDIYNMQFEHSYVANERFAAKGMVSLNIRQVDKPNIDARTAGLSEAILELVDLADSELVDKTSVDSELSKICQDLNGDLQGAIDELTLYANSIAEIMRSGPGDVAEYEKILMYVDYEKALANQGLYLTNWKGDLIAQRREHQNVQSRDAIFSSHGRNFGDRPYFQMAKSNRRPFVSNYFRSIFNENSTFAICLPIVFEDEFLGLLFSACQIGQWERPITLARAIELGVYILDGLGVVGIPPYFEFLPEKNELVPGENPDRNIGYSFTRLKILSKKDKVIIRLAENIVPIDKDDDIISLDKNLDIYAKIQNLGDLGWRCAVSRAIKFAD